MPHTPGQAYTREHIRAEYDGVQDKIYFVVHHGNQIRALRLRRFYNPKIDQTPAEVWVARGPEREPWGERLALDTGAVPLYVADSRDEDAYAYRGVYHVIGNTQESAILAIAEQVPGIEPLSRIVYLSGPHT